MSAGQLQRIGKRGSLWLDSCGDSRQAASSGLLRERKGDQDCHATYRRSLQADVIIYAIYLL
jgi:hypothetical protein